MTSTGRRSVLLDVGDEGARLRVSVSPHHVAGIVEDPWFDAWIEVDAFPFSGTVETILTLEDLREWAASMRSTEPLPRDVVLGGNRAAEVVVHVAPQRGGEPGALALEISVTPSGDDPDPFVRFLVFDARPFWDESAARIDALDHPGRRAAT